MAHYRQFWVNDRRRSESISEGKRCLYRGMRVKDKTTAETRPPTLACHGAVVIRVHHCKCSSCGFKLKYSAQVGS